MAFQGSVFLITTVLFVIEWGYQPICIDQTIRICIHKWVTKVLTLTFVCRRQHFWWCLNISSSWGFLQYFLKLNLIFTMFKWFLNTKWLYRREKGKKEKKRWFHQKLKPLLIAKSILIRQHYFLLVTVPKQWRHYRTGRCWQTIVTEVCLDFRKNHKKSLTKSSPGTFW